MQKSEIMSRYGHENFEWVMSKAPNLIENEDGTTRDYGPYNGWQTWDGELMTDKETGEYTMVYVPYWGNDTEEGIAGEMFTKFYRAILADGTKANYGGYIANLQFEDLSIEKRLKLMNKVKKLLLMKKWLLIRRWAKFL